MWAGSGWPTIWPGRRRRLAGLVSPDEDRAAFDRDGFVAKRNFLDPETFARLKEQTLNYQARPARWCRATRSRGGSPSMARPAARCREVDALLRRKDWSGLMRYVGSYRSGTALLCPDHPVSHVKDAAPDPQTNFHADTFHPSVKAWFFLTDVAEDEGPFCYVPGSHRLTPERIAWEREMSIGAADHSDRYSARGSFRASAADLERMKLPKPVAFAVPANTLVVGDTVGFHARGFSARPSRRVEIWAYGRRNPFLALGRVRSVQPARHRGGPHAPDVEGARQGAGAWRGAKQLDRQGREATVG